MFLQGKHNFTNRFNESAVLCCPLLAQKFNKSSFDSRKQRINEICVLLSAVFPWTNLLVVVVELEGSEQEALDLVPMVTKAVLEEHYLIVGVSVSY